ncbi:hypothetical protein CPC08DRAFT_823951 [Agrocybe pediades]|nr:hypothetical protein CPC08DRAFT_823951 [Agrocybe pediades]
MSNVDIDDSDTSSISYSGSWVEIGGGPSNEFDGTVHSTTENGATATIVFQGTSILLKCTVPQGTGTMSMVSFVDGEMAGFATRRSTDTPLYDDLWLNKTLPDGQHEVVIQNTGDANSPFQLDRFIITGSVIPVQGAEASPTANPSPTTTAQPGVTNVPAISSTTSAPLSSTAQSSSPSPSLTTLSTGPSSSSRSSAAGSKNGSLGESILISTSIQVSTTTTDGNQETQISSSVAGSTSRPKQNIGMIVGGIIAGIVFLLLLLLFLCMRQRRRLAVQLPRPLNDSERGTTVHGSSSSITPFVIGDAHRHGGIQVPIRSLKHASSSRQDNVHVYANEKSGRLIRDTPDPAASYTVPTSNFPGADSGVNVLDVSADNASSVAQQDRILEITGDIIHRSSVGPISSSGHASSLSIHSLNQFSLPQPLQPQDIADETPPSYESTRNHYSYPVINVQTPSTSARSVIDGFEQRISG